MLCIAVDVSDVASSGGTIGCSKLRGGTRNTHLVKQGSLSISFAVGKTFSSYDNLKKLDEFEKSHSVQRTQRDSRTLAAARRVPSLKSSEEGLPEEKGDLTGIFVFNLYGVMLYYDCNL